MDKALCPQAREGREGGEGRYLYDVRTEEEGCCPKRYNSTDKLRELDNDKWEGSNFADVI